ncbi:MAG: DUF3795 domain-containing protein [Promethearchaeota archaeon]
MSKHLIKNYPTLACCGLDCGLCPRFHTEGSSKCPGCCGPNFLNKHPSCSIITCCVKKKKLEVCAQCDEFPCSKLEKNLNTKYDSFLTYKKVQTNLEFIQKNGIEPFIEQQKKRINLLEEILRDFNEGRSKNFYCIAATLLPIKDLEKALVDANQKMKTDKVEQADIKNKSMILKEFLNNLATSQEIELKLRKKK